MRFEPRQYQQDTVDALWDVVAFRSDKHPVIAVPTGAGKTVIMGMFIKKYIDTYPDNRVVILSHTQDILEQDHDALQEFFPEEEIGLYSAGLGSRSVEQITVAGIQSAYRQPKKFAFTNLYLIDECHTVNHKNEGMYRKLLERNHSVKIGMSATVYRTGHGVIYDGKGTLFNHLAYDLTSLENFNKLVDDGFLTTLISLSPEMKMNINGVKKTGGDYQVKDLANRFDKDKITKVAVEEIVKYGKNYKKWLVFAIDIDHADNICDMLRTYNITTDVLHSRMGSDRGDVTSKFKNGNTRALVSVGMVTTGFDAPNVDLIALLRPTMSAVLHVQMVGRGLRIAEGKSHCLVLDFAGNTKRLGPINNVLIPNKKGNGGGEAPTKTCPECSTILPASVRICGTCEHEFQFETKLTTSAASDEIVEKGKAKNKDKWLNVSNVQYQVHSKEGKPDSLLVLYHCGITRVKDWVCLDHSGYAKHKANHWCAYRGYRGKLTTEEVFLNRKSLLTPKKIQVDFSTRYPFIKGYEF